MLYRGKQIEQKHVPCQELTQRYTDEVVDSVDRLKKHADDIRAELSDVRTNGTDQRKINLVDPQER